MPALVLSLRNGLQLTITGEPTLRALANFLKAAIVHFKSQRDIQQVKVYAAGSFQGRVAGGDCAISHPGDSSGNHLPPAAWAEAVLDVYRRLVALDESRPTTFAPADDDDVGTAAVGAISDQPPAAMHLLALRAWLEQSQN